MGLIEPTAGRVTWGGRARRAADAPRHRVPAPGDAAPQRRRQHPLRAGERRRRARRMARRASTNCSRWSASPDSASGRRGGCPAASSSGLRSRARSRAIRRCCSSTSRPRASIPAATKAIEDVIRAVAARGIKVVMSTHDLGEARRLAGEIVLLHRGRVIESAPGRRIFRQARRPKRRAGSSPASCWSDAQPEGGNAMQTRRHPDRARRRAALLARRARAPRRTSRSSSPRPPRRRTPACSATSCRCSRPRPAST